ncbi:glycosyltransferase family 4 protein [Christiangramia sabulilitoris]|uniref:Glycosyltransferase family 4 protein n=1 Tax=Christiangramia sabulilitoris TaxID=2583991 RepID=A0A550HYS9_9FLAO|nr:glycosyltransferase family 4 protein [Christiangramia sabulilitoris]TRO63892.1 glycosyltransferase family 4 protein [Christiangramia sabulilitoris]
MRNILYIGNKLVKHGYTPTSADTLPRKLEHEGFCVTAVSSIKNRGLRLMHMLGSIIARKNVDLVIIDTYSTLNYWYAVMGAGLCRVLSIPYIMILHGGNLEMRLEGSSKKMLALFRNAKALVVPSRFLKEKLEKFQFENLLTIPNSIEINDYSFKRRTQVSPRLLWVRAFDEIYRPELAMDVLELVLKDYPEADLCMVGPDKDGSLPRLQKLGSEQRLPVVFEGKLTKSEWTSLAADYDIFINTTSIDNTPVSVIEAMALGLPVVSTNVGGLPYLIEHDLNGILVEPDNASAMAGAILSLINKPELAHKISLNARKMVEKFDWENVKTVWLELLAEK